MLDYQTCGEIFIDLHDVLPHLESDSRAPLRDLDELIEATRSFLTRKVDTKVAGTRVYADFDVLAESGYKNLADRLYRSGVHSHYICLRYESLDTNLSLALDVATSISTRPELGRIVVISGSRDYIPLFRMIEQSGRTGTLISFADEIPQALKTTGSFDTFISAADLLKGREIDMGKSEETTAPSSNVASDFHEAKALPYEIDRDALRIIELNFGHYEEVYLSPLLRKLSETIDPNSGHEPKTVISDLNRHGAIRLEKRHGEKYDYTVLIVNSSHPDVLSVREEVAEARIAGHHKEEQSAKMEEPGEWEQDFAEMWERLDDDQFDDNKES